MKLKCLLALLLASLLGACSVAGAQEETDPKGMRPPAWYTEPALGAKWNQLTGRYIFERSCTSCHFWGPDHFTRGEWSEYLEHFPDNHEVPVAGAYADLTAMFQPSRYVPDAAQRNNTLREFLLKEAPEAIADPSRRTAAFASLPKVGDIAPDFEIDDIEGHHHKVSNYKGKKQLVLIFSRAYW